MLDVDTMRRAAGVDWAALGRRYIEATRPLTGKSPRFTDKLPHNFLYAGYIANALPGAKLVLVRRNPMDTCLGNFRQLFSLVAPNYDYRSEEPTSEIQSLTRISYADFRRTQ